MPLLGKPKMPVRACPRTPRRRGRRRARALDGGVRRAGARASGRDAAGGHRVGPRHHFDVRRVAEGLNRPAGRRRTRGRRRALGPPSSRAGSCASTTAARRRAGPAPARADRHRAGLLGIAFHPDFATQAAAVPAGATGRRRVAEHRAGGPPDDRATARARAASRPPARGEPQRRPARLGPDGRLYLGLGDGGGAFDPAHSAGPAQPAGEAAGRRRRPRRAALEVVLTGVRNPWRFSFDNALGEVWVADVGQDDTRRSTASCSSPTSRPRTSAGASSRAPAA